MSINNRFSMILITADRVRELKNQIKIGKDPIKNYKKGVVKFALEEIQNGLYGADYNAALDRLGYKSKR